MGDLGGGPGGGEVVQGSRYAALFGIPVAFYGVAGYAVLFVLGLAGLQPARAGDRRLAVLVAALATGGFAFTLYLTSLELLVLHAICRLCIGSAAVLPAIFVLALTGLRANAWTP